MSIVPGKKEKPPVPPKPKFLGKTNTVPNPPEHEVNRIQEIIRTMKLPVSKQENHYGEDGYLKPVSPEKQVENQFMSLQEVEQPASKSIKKQVERVKDHDGRDMTSKRANLGSRLTNEMADLSANVKQKMFKTISFRFPSSRRDSSLESISEEFSDSQGVKDVRQRPLPLLPGERIQSVVGMPWFSPVDRRNAEEMVKKGKDGCFVIRPSSKGESSLALTLWYKGRSYNIPIRKRQDKNYALGTPKDLEQSFNSIEEMIKNYERDELVLYSNGVETGRTTLHALNTT